MAYRKKTNKWVWALILGALVVVGAKYSSTVKTWVQKIPVVGPMIYPVDKATE